MSGVEIETALDGPRLPLSTATREYGPGLHADARVTGLSPTLSPAFS